MNLIFFNDNTSELQNSGYSITCLAQNYAHWQGTPELFRIIFSFMVKSSLSAKTAILIYM